LGINLLTEASEWEKGQKGDPSSSSIQVLAGCCGAIGGFFQPTSCPAIKALDSFPRSSCRLHCQAIWDSRLRFLFFSIIAPDQTNDALVYEQTLLQEILEDFQCGTFIAGDAAHILTQHRLVPFAGSCKQDLDKDSYNFDLLQLRIRIEISFGLLTTKGRILWRKLGTTLKNSTTIIEAYARMHKAIMC
jgi:hypothetical protein